LFFDKINSFALKDAPDNLMLLSMPLGTQRFVLYMQHGNLRFLCFYKALTPMAIVGLALV
jgi:hypothetical protein